jgi:ABC-type branched-subunit amino acid transport system substrate-binding protein
MSSRKASTIALGLLVILSMVLSACAPAATPTPEVIVQKETQVVVVTATPEPPTPEPGPAALPDVIKIGVNETMTGWGAPYGDMTWKGIQLAHEKKPEVLGRPVELILADNKSDNTESATVAQRFIDVEKVVAVIGVNSSSKAIAQN